MIPTPTNKSKETDTASKTPVYDATYSDTILPPILEQIISEQFTEQKQLSAKFNATLDKCIQRIADLEAQTPTQISTVDSKDLHLRRDPSIHSLNAKVHHKSSRLIICNGNQP